MDRKCKAGQCGSSHSRKQTCWHRGADNLGRGDTFVQGSEEELQLDRALVIAFICLSGTYYVQRACWAPGMTGKRSMSCP